MLFRSKRLGAPKHPEGPIPEDGGGGGGGGGLDPHAERPLDKSFGYGKNFGAKYELGKEVGRGHFGHTCSARAKKGDIKGQVVAVKIISKAKVRWYCKGGFLNVKFLLLLHFACSPSIFLIISTKILVQFLKLPFFGCLTLVPSAPR